VFIKQNNTLDSRIRVTQLKNFQSTQDMFTYQR